MIKLTLEVETEKDIDDLHIRERISDSIRSRLSVISGIKGVKITHEGCDNRQTENNRDRTGK